MSVEKIQEFMGRLCPVHVSVPEDMLGAFIELVHYCMRYPDLLVAVGGLKDQLTLKAAELSTMKHEHVRFLPVAIVERTVSASKAYLYFVRNVV
jgi:hypothetical protein